MFRSTLKMPFLVVLALSTFFVSCDQNRTCRKECENGYCDDGDCVCFSGYSGQWCATSSSGGSSSGGSSSGGSSSGGGICTNTCQYANDGVCDDGGPGSTYNVCTYGTDCNDCGIRYGTSSSGGSSSGSSSSSGGGTTGQLMVYNTNSQPCPPGAGSTISVYIDGVYAGGLSSYFTSTPSCGASGAITQTLSIGTHSVSGVCGSYTWGPGNINVVAGGCSKYELY